MYISTTVIIVEDLRVRSKINKYKRKEVNPVKVEVPYKIGDQVRVNGKTETIRGIHIYVTQTSEVSKWRFHIGGGKFVTIENIEAQENKRYVRKKNHRRGR